MSPDRKFYRGYAELLFGAGAIFSYVSHHATPEMFREQTSLAEAVDLHKISIKYKSEREICAYWDGQ